MAALTTRAVLLRTHDYGETSRVLRFYTEELGLLGVMGKGVRGRSGKGGSGLTTFTTGSLTAWVRPNRDLHTMKDFASARTRAGLAGDMLRFAGASAVAELVLVHADQESHPGLFAALEAALDRIESAPSGEVPAACLGGAWSVVEAFGFAPQLDPCVRCGRPIAPEEVARFDSSAGGVRCAACGEGAAGPLVGPGARAQILGLLGEPGAPALTHARRHFALLSDFVAYHVASRPLKSLRFLGDLLPPDEGVDA